VEDSRRPSAKGAARRFGSRSRAPSDLQPRRQAAGSPFLRRDEIAITRCFGVLTPEDLFAAGELQPESKRVDHVEVIDLRAVSDLPIERSDFRRFIARMQSRTSNAVRIAFVTHTPLAFGMARTLESFLELASCPSEVRVFDAHADVAEWILRGRDADHVEWLCERLSSPPSYDA